MTARITMSHGRLFFAMAIHVILGIPMVAFLWETLNGLLALEVSATRLALSIPVLMVFCILLWVLARSVDRWMSAEIPR